MPRSVLHLDSIDAADLALLRKEYPRWTFDIGAAGTGTFDILQYDPFALTVTGGADFTVLYEDGVPQARTYYNWIQIAHPHNWGKFDSINNIDSEFASYPFTYTPISLPTLTTSNIQLFVDSPAIWHNTNEYPPQKIQNPVGGGKVPTDGDLLFVDEPACPFACLPPDDIASDEFSLFLVTFTWNDQRGAAAAGTVTILDGMEWGVLITTTCTPTPASPQLVQLAAAEPCVVPEPEPSAISILIVGVGGTLLLLLKFRRRGTGPESQRCRH